MRWEDLHPDDGNMYPVDQDIWTYPIIFGLILITFRSWILNPLILEPFAKSIGVVCKVRKPLPPNPTLERIFVSNNGCVPAAAILEASVSLQLTRRQVERWLRSRAALTKLTKLDKFQDSAYICIYHTFITIYGLYVMLRKPWLWNISLTYENFPYHPIDTGIWWYYMIGCGFYWSQTIWQYKFSHGKDANIGYVHHICTILLMACSWTCNYVRIGTLVLLVHECGDIPLQIVKCLRYVHQGVSHIVDITYGCFLVLWFTTRIYLFPFWILRCIMFEMPKTVTIRAFSIFNSFLILLMILNIIWTLWILYSLYKRLVVGYVEVVISSEDDGGSCSDAKAEKKRKII